MIKYMLDTNICIFTIKNKPLRMLLHPADLPIVAGNPGIPGALHTIHFALQCLYRARQPGHRIGQERQVVLAIPVAV